MFRKPIDTTILRVPGVLASMATPTQHAIIEQYQGKPILQEFATRAQIRSGNKNPSLYRGC